jgi:hypothetical protein
MHAYKLRDQNELRKNRNLLALQNLPDLPLPETRHARRGHNLWLRRVAACFLLVSLGLIIRSAWASLSVVG